MLVTEHGPSLSAFWESVGIFGKDQVIRQIRAGFQYGVFEAVMTRFELKKSELVGALRISTTTIRRREQSGRLTPQESDFLYRAVWVLETAESVFEGDAELMMSWMRCAVPAIGGRRPIDMLATCAESEWILQTLRNLQYGDFS